MAKKRQIIFRVDGGTQLGMGHIQRTIILSSELANEFDFHFYIREDDVGFNYLESAGLQTYRLPQDMEGPEEAEILITGKHENPPLVIIVDILDTSKNYMQVLKYHGSKIVTLENQGDGASLADVVINSIVEGPESKDFTRNGTRYLKGARFKILSPDFDVQYPDVQKDNIPKVVVTLGGGDLTSSLPKVLKAVAGIKRDVHLTVIAGPAYQGFESLKNEVKRLPLHIGLHREVSNMAKVLSGKDIAITAGGGTLYEIAYMGIPGIALCQCDHQEKNASIFESMGTVINLGNALEVSLKEISRTLATLLSDPVKRKEMSRKGKELIDGKGRERVTKIIRELAT